MTLQNSTTSAATDAVLQALLAAFPGGAPADDTALATALTDASQAYAVQAWLVAALDGSNQPARHWKSGGPSRQAELTHAPLPARGVRPSGARLDDLPLRHRFIEAEVALRLGRAVTAAQAAAASPAECAGWVDAMCVSIEVVDSRWASARAAPALLRLADLQSHGALVLGDWVPFAQRDWARQVCRVRIGAGAWQSFEGTHSLADPAWLLPAWLRHATRDGAPVAAGTVVTTGTWCGLLDAAPGDRVEVEFPRIGAASAQL